MNQMVFNRFGFRLTWALCFVLSASLVEQASAQEVPAVQDAVEQAAPSLENDATSSEASEALTSEQGPAENDTTANDTAANDTTAEDITTEADAGESSNNNSSVEENALEEAAAEAPASLEEKEADETVEEGEELDAEAEAGIDYAGLVERAPDFFAVTHPALVHFPIALWLFGAFFVVVGWIIPSWGQQIPLGCLLFGTLSGIAATLSGWWYADYNGYGDWKEIDWTDAFFQHRWLGVVLTAASLFISMIAIYAARTESRTAGFVWKFGLLLLAIGVGYEGHLGGSLIHSTSIEEAFIEWIYPE